MVSTRIPRDFPQLRTDGARKWQANSNSKMVPNLLLVFLEEGFRAKSMIIWREIFVILRAVRVLGNNSAETTVKNLVAAKTQNTCGRWKVYSVMTSSCQASNFWVRNSLVTESIGRPGLRRALPMEWAELCSCSLLFYGTCQQAAANALLNIN